FRGRTGDDHKGGSQCAITSEWTGRTRRMPCGLWRRMDSKIAAHTVPHTAEGLSEWGRELDQWRAQGGELWAAIERREGRVVDFLLDHGVAVYPVNPQALDRARDRFRQRGAKDDPFECTGARGLSAHGPRAPPGTAAEFGSCPGAQTPHGRLPAADPA